MGLKNNKLLRMLVVMVLVVGMFSITAFADTDSVAIYVHDISADTDTLVATYDLTDLNDTSEFTTIAKHNYSSITCHNTYQYYTAKGPELQEIFTKALSGSGVSLNDVEDVEIIASDTSIEISKDDLLASRSWYNTDHSFGGTTKAILATSYTSGLNAADNTLSTSNTLRDFYGQTSFTDYVIANFIKNTATITLYVQ
ncbi:hypothetical protein [Anaerovorax odorimutans]|uniref:hypothetical protein n=1 Tax=Anaerovorax odorimutans TaxID=109327 RepID=UPI0004101296|nr:hypothetical protein [Anaerovorax odorimutans]